MIGCNVCGRSKFLWHWLSGRLSYAGMLMCSWDVFGFIWSMVIRVVMFSSGRYKIRKFFALESTYPKLIGDLSKIGHHFCKWSDLIIDLIKKRAPKIVLFNEKKRLRKIRMIFDIENWLWKSEFGLFWPSLLKWTKGLELFHGRFHRPLALLIHH